MDMEGFGQFRVFDDRFEFRYPELGLTVRGAYADWVLEAAAEILKDSVLTHVETDIGGS